MKNYGINSVIISKSLLTAYVKAFLMCFHFAVRISISNKNKSKPMQRRMKNRNYFTIRIIRIMSPRFSFDKQYPWSFDYTNHTNFPMRILYRRFDINTIFLKRECFISGHLWKGICQSGLVIKKISWLIFVQWTVSFFHLPKFL